MDYFHLMEGFQVIGKDISDTIKGACFTYLSIPHLAFYIIKKNMTIKFMQFDKFHSLLNTFIILKQYFRVNIICINGKCLKYEYLSHNILVSLMSFIILPKASRGAESANSTELPTTNYVLTMQVL